MIFSDEPWTYETINPGTDKKTGFATPSGKVELPSSVLEKLGYDPLPAFKLSAVDADFARPVLLGEHTDYVCREILGMPEGEIARLRQKGVFE